MYQSTHTGAQVDEAVDKALSADAVPTPGSTNLVESGGVFAALSNRNLLDNGWFTVNQRGSASYTSAGYTVDRWYNKNALVASVDSSGLTLNPNGQSNRQFGQKIENASSLGGKNVTLSVVVTANSLTGGMYGQVFGINNLLAPAGQTGLFQIQLTLPSTISDNEVLFRFNASAVESGTITISAVKLELGSVSTLANDAPPNYAEELAKCQRFLYVVKAPAAVNLTLCAANALDATSIYAALAVPPQMRTPTLSLSSSGAIKCGATTFTITPSSVSVYSYAAGIATILIAATSLTAGTTYRVGLMAGESIIFAADL